MLKRAYISEKSMDLAKTGLYTFEVSKRDTKDYIAKAVAKRFSVDVLSVSTIVVKGKTKQQRTRKGYYTQSLIKKALVQVKKNQKIALFETVEDNETKVTTGDEALVKKEKKVLKNTKIKVEKVTDEKEKVTVKKTEKPKTAKQKSIAKKSSKKGVK